jgi:hypothetical protein
MTELLSVPVVHQISPLLQLAPPTSECFLEAGARSLGFLGTERCQIQASLLDCMKRVLNILQVSRSLSLMPSINLHCFFHDSIA